MSVQIGDQAPLYQQLPAHGKWTLLYFYPKDFTSGCIKEACNFRDNFNELSKKITIIGVSADSDASHKKFTDQYHLPFSLIADPDKQFIRAYGADGLLFARRTSFLIDDKRVIRKIYNRVNPATHASDIQTDLSCMIK